LGKSVWPHNASGRVAIDAEFRHGVCDPESFYFGRPTQPPAVGMIELGRDITVSCAQGKRSCLPAYPHGGFARNCEFTGLCLKAW
jgi:hypothetical protein